MPDNIEGPRHHLILTGRRDGQNGRVVGYTTVLDDAFTRDVLAQMTLYYTTTGYALAKVRQPDGSYRLVKLHKVVYEQYRGPVPPGLVLDHRDRNKLNNVPSNLRAVTRSINAANKGLDRDSRSGFKGVSWNERRQLWVANVTKEGRQKYLGAFTDKAAAARCVNQAYRELFPEVPIPNPSVEPAPALAG